MITKDSNKTSQVKAPELIREVQTHNKKKSNVTRRVKNGISFMYELGGSLEWIEETDYAENF